MRQLLRLALAGSMVIGTWGVLVPPAGATVTGRESFRTSDVRTFVDIGCHEQDLITLTEDVQGRLVEVNGGLRVEALMSGLIVFAEEGQSFAGRFAQPFTLTVRADGSVTSTQTYTASAQGDQGNVAILHATAHTTYLGPSGTVVTSFEIVHQSCA